RRDVIAVGDEAREMVGRTPDGLEAVRPVRAGRIVDVEVAEALLTHLVHRVHGRSRWVRPRVLAAVPSDAPEADHRALRDCCEGIGIRELRLIDRPLAAARGAELAAHGTSGHMV